MELKSCPFCNDTNIRITRTTVDLIENVKYQGICLHCGATSGHPRLSREKAIKAWNTRVRNDKEGL